MGFCIQDYCKKGSAGIQVAKTVIINIEPSGFPHKRLSEKAPKALGLPHKLHEFMKILFAQ